MEIKAIETVYKGYRFRSRLEARWAVFFDALGLEWEYEKEGYELPDGTRYLPDFWFPYTDEYTKEHKKLISRDRSKRMDGGIGIWVEIKGVEPTEAERNKCELLCKGTLNDVHIWWGSPYGYWHATIYKANSVRGTGVCIMSDGIYWDGVILGSNGGFAPDPPPYFWRESPVFYQDCENNPVNGEYYLQHYVPFLYLKSDVPQREWYKIIETAADKSRAARFEFADAYHA